MAYIDKDKLNEAMYHEAFEKDSDFQKWDSGCWIRYKLFENVLKSIPTADVVEKERYDRLLENANILAEAVRKYQTADVPERNVGKWIPVTERLPEANEKDELGFIKAYLVQDARWMDVARWDGEYWVAWGHGTVLKNVTAWMPLPEIYRGERN